MSCAAFGQFFLVTLICQKMAGNLKRKFALKWREIGRENLP
jgi:hypothetical protein